MTGVTIDSNSIETGVNQTRNAIRSNYPDAEAVRNAIVSGGYMGLYIPPDVKNAANAQIGQSNFGDQFFDNLGNEASGAVWGAGLDITERGLTSQKDLALTHGEWK